MKFEVNKEIKELTAIDCKSQDRTREMLDRYKDSVQYDAATDCCKMDAKDFERIETTVNIYNRIEEEKKAVFEEILKEKGPEEAAKAEQDFYDAFLPGGKYEGSPESLNDALEDIRETYLMDKTRELEQGKSLDLRSLVRELQTLEKETAHEM